MNKLISASLFSLLALAGCVPEPIFVLEQLSGGKWVETLSEDIAIDGLSWEIHQAVERRGATAFTETKNETRATPIAGCDVSEETWQSVDLGGGTLFGTARQEEVFQYLEETTRFGLNVDMAPLKEAQAAFQENSELPVFRALNSLEREALRTELAILGRKGGPVPIAGLVDQALNRGGVSKRAHAYESEMTEAGRKAGRLDGLLVCALYEVANTLKSSPAPNVVVSDKSKERLGMEEGDISGAETEAERAKRLLKQLATSQRPISSVMADFVPSHPDFWKLTEVYERYRGICRAGGWEKVAYGKLLKLGRKGTRVDSLRARLIAEGYAVESADVFDQSLEDAVRLYQETHHLKDSGEADKRTLRSMNVSCDERLRQVGASLLKWRETRIADHTREHIFVNIPEFQGEVWRDGRVVHSFKAVVGKARRKRTRKGVTYPNATPELFSYVTHVVLNPYWNVPKKIAEDEILPLIDEKPELVDTKKYEVMESASGRKSVRQAPGPWNALGLVKFSFPNSEAIYLHDTASKKAFKVPYRALSHGCVRVENALELSELLLRADGRWRRSYKYNPKKAPDTYTERWVGLNEPIPVYLEYYVVSVDEQGRTIFGKDMYRRYSDLLAEHDRQWEESKTREAAQAEVPSPPEE